MIAKRVDLTFDRTALWSKTLTFRDNNADPVDLGDYEFFGEVRRRPGAPALATFTFSFVTDGSDGQVAVTFTPGMASLLKDGAEYMYDWFFRTSTSDPKRFVHGAVKARGNVSVPGTVVSDPGSGDAGIATVWGNITGTLSNQTDLQTALSGKQATITFGTGVQTALGANVGSAGAPILFNGAGGTPSSMTLTNATGLPLAGILAAAKSAGGLGTLDNGKLATYRSDGGLQSTSALPTFSPDGLRSVSPLVADATAGIGHTLSGTSDFLIFPATPATRSWTLPESPGTVALVGASARVPYTYVVANDVTASTSMTDITGLAFPVLANKKYAVILHLATAKNDANGIRLQITGPSSPTRVDGSAAGTTVDDNTFVTLSFLAFSSETASFNTVSGNGRVRAGTVMINNGANAGTVQLQFRAVTGGTATIRAGSWIQVTPLD